MPNMSIEDTTGDFGITVHCSVSKAKSRARKYIEKGLGTIEYRWHVDATYRVLEIKRIGVDDPHVCDVSVKVGDGDLTGGTQ